MKKLSLFLVPAFCCAILVYFAVRPTDTDILKQSIPDVKTFYSQNADIIENLYQISQKQTDYSISSRADDPALRVLIQGTEKELDTLFDASEQEIIQQAFSVSCNGISIEYFDSSGRLILNKWSGRFRFDIQFCQNEAEYFDWNAEYIEPLADDWYLLIVDSRPALA